MPRTTVLDKATPNDGFVHLIANCFRARAELARESLGSPYESPGAPRHVAALEALADYLVGLSPDDQRVHSLFLTQGLLGGDTDEYQPGAEMQMRFLTTIGDGTHVPQPNEALNEYVAAGVADITERVHERSQKIIALEGRVKDADNLQTELTEAKEQIERLSTELREASDQIQALRDQREYLRALVPDDDATEPGASSASPSSGDGLDSAESEPKEAAVARA